MSPLPTMPVGVDRYLADTAHMTLEEQAVHFRLQIYAWRSPGCCLPDDDSRLARMLGITPKRWASLKPAVMALWTLNDGDWTNDQVAREHEFVTSKIEKKRAAGKLGGRPKSLPDNDPGKASGSENGKQNESEPKAATATATKKESPVVPKGTDRDGFDEFRTAYPRRSTAFPATDARKRWLQARRGGADPAEIVAGARAYAAEQAGLGKVGTEYIKTADVWLRQQRWKDFTERPDTPTAAGAVSDDVWRERVRLWQSRRGHWPWRGSEPPDDPRTKVPPHILAELGILHAAGTGLPPLMRVSA